MAQFNIMTELWLKIWVTLLKRILIKEKDEGIQIFVIRALNTTAIIYPNCIFLVNNILQVSSWK